MGLFALAVWRERIPVAYGERRQPYREVNKQAGIHIARLVTPEYTKSIKMALLK